MEPKKKSVIYWHPAFFANIQIELKDEADKLTFENEHHLSKKPMQIDVLIIKKEKAGQIRKNIGKIFKKHNVIEYKSPGRSLGIDDFYKVYGYACFYKADVVHADAIPAKEVTITFVSERFPRKLIRHLRTVKKYDVEKAEDGIYNVKGDVFSIQILVTRELSEKENLWLKSLTNNLKEPENARQLIVDYQKNQENDLYRSALEAIMHANQKVFQEVNGMTDIFMEIVQEKFDRKLKEETEKAVGKAVEEALETARLTERISLIQKKCAKNKPLSVIAEELETESDEVLPIFNIIIQNPGKTAEEICELVI
ncbi:MAG: hypothetical protein HFH19_04805 [Ruminococcus sp.]|nr:hypothetical protein [Ruminococcus sp.]